jgi:hypothetical protein
MKKDKPYLICLFALVFVTPIKAQISGSSPSSVVTSRITLASLEDSLYVALEKTGWLNLHIYADGDRLLIAYENRLYRFEARAIKALVNQVAPIIGNRYRQLDLVVMSRNEPLIGISLSLQAWNDFQKDEQSFPAFAKSIETTLDVQKNWQLLRGQTVRHPGAYRIDAFLDPQLKMGLGGYPKPILAQINLLPTANVFLWRGAQLTLQTIVPVLNQLPIPEDKLFRPGLIAFNQYFRLPGASFVGLSAGYFTNYSYGAEIELSKFFLNGRLIWRGKAGYTGYASYPQRLRLEKPVPGWQISSLNYLDYQSSLEYRLAKYDFVMKVEAGRYLYFQNSVKVSAVRQFKETDLGFFAMKNDKGVNYGFQVSVPIFPKKYGKPKLVQFRPGKAFDYTYTATQATLESYRTGNDIYGFFKKLNPLFIKNQLINPSDWR